MRNFIIFFNEKEGTSPLIKVLNNFPQIDIILTTKNDGLEPFDFHTCGAISNADLENCLNYIYQSEYTPIDIINSIYKKKAQTTLKKFSYNNSRGLKMRFKSPGSINNKVEESCLNSTTNYEEKIFQEIMFNTLKKHKVVVFITVRQDIMRWALSKYHGDGTGKPGHLQFKLQDGRISRKDIRSIKIDIKRFKEIINQCYHIINQKIRLYHELKENNIDTYPVFYEQFSHNKVTYFSEFLDKIEINNNVDLINNVLEQGEHFEKVHNDDISTFVENHEEILSMFGNEYLKWDEYLKAELGE